MLLYRSLGYLNPIILKQTCQLTNVQSKSIIKSNLNSLYYKSLTNQQHIFNESKHLLINSTINKFNFQFATIKKSNKITKQKFTLHKSKFNKKDSNNLGYLIYDAKKQQKSFKIIGGIFILVFGLSLLKLYYTEQQYWKDQYPIIAIIFISFVVYQRRINQTLKKMSITPKGDKLYMTTFNYLANGEKNIQTPIQIMKGISKATKLGGNVIKGGGQYDYKQMKFWFDKEYILDRETFQHVSSGNYVKVVDDYETL